MKIELILGSKIRLRIARYLLEQENALTCRELASSLRIDHKSVSAVVKDFEKVDLVSIEVYGRSFAVKMNMEHKLVPILSRLFEVKL